jgi:hypothetical protein
MQRYQKNRLNSMNTAAEARDCRFPAKSLKKWKLIKSVVGKVRTSSYQLPGDDFVYGIVNKMDNEGAGKVMQSWSQLEPSQPQASMQSFPATNRIALKNGCLDAKSQRLFGKNNPVLKKKSRWSKEGPSSLRSACTINQNCNKRNSSTRIPELLEQAVSVFGMKNSKTDMQMTQLLRESSPICALDETDYPDVTKMKKKGRLPPAKQTKSSQLLKDAVIQSSQQGARAEWKMKRFVNGIESKVCLKLKGLE